MQSDGQKSMHNYFMSEKQTTVSSPFRRGTVRSPSGSKRTLLDDEAELLSSTPAKKKPPSSKHVIVIDSDIDEDEENVFECSTKYRNRNLIHSASKKNIFRGQTRQNLTSTTCRKKTTRSRPGKWNCAVCTYSNHPMISYCEMCSTGRDSQPSCSSAESVALVHCDLVASSVSEVHSLASGSRKAVSEPPSCQQDSNSCLSSLSQENRTQLQSYSLESDADEELTVPQTDELSDCMLPDSAACNTSLLKTLSINGEQATDDNDSSNSYSDKSLITNVEAASSSALRIDFSDVTVHELLQFSCSRNSSRIYIYSKVLAVFDASALLFLRPLGCLSVRLWHALT